MTEISPSWSQRRPPSAEALSAASDILNLWNSGQQEPALAQLSSFAESGEPWAIALRVFLRIQQGPPSYMQVMADVRRASTLGMPWVVTYFAQNALPSAAAHGQGVDEILSVLEVSMFPWPIHPSVDLISVGWNLLSSGHLESGLRILNTQVQTPPGWGQDSERIHAYSVQLSETLAEVGRMGADIRSSAAQTNEALEVARQDVVSKASSVSVLIDQIADKTAMSLYEKSEKRDEEEAKEAWKWGQRALVLTVVAALMPVALHYLGLGPKYSSITLLSAHLGLTAALGALAGVQLTRARTRDHARQRSRDLATAMGTMIVYSERIEDSVARQTFMETTGRTILDAHLSGGSSLPAQTTDLGGLASLISELRRSNPPAA